MTIRIERDGKVATVIHSRPEARNAMDPESAEALTQAFLDSRRRCGVSAIVFWGEGGAFCAGWDLKYAQAFTETERFQSEIVEGLAFPAGDGAVPRGPMGPSRLEMSKPLIAAVEGPAVAGGMELALWCDIRVIGESAYFGVYCRRWGIPLIDGGTVRLPRLVGQGRALEIILTGRKVEAQEALRIGLCEQVVADGGARAGRRGDGAADRPLPARGDAGRPAQRHRRPWPAGARGAGAGMGGRRRHDRRAKGRPARAVSPAARAGAGISPISDRLQAASHGAKPPRFSRWIATSSACRKAERSLAAKGLGPPDAVPMARRSSIMSRVASAMPIEASVKGLAGVADDVGAGLDAAIGERNIAGDDDGAARDPFGDPVIGGVEPVGDDDALDPGLARHGHEAVGDDEDLDAMPLGDTIDFRLHRAGVGIDVDLDRSSS